MQNATGNTVLRAWDRIAGRLALAKGLTSATSSAGFVIPKGQKTGARKGYQVFVKMVRWDESKLKSDPMHGGLLDDV